MSEIKVNKISPRSGTTVTLGDSGDTFTIPAGATINNQGTATNFGATGSASWTTTVKTSGFTAVAGEGYFVNTTSGPISVNLPAGTAGAVVAFKDYANTFDTSALTLVQNGSDKIGGSTVNAKLNTEGIAATLIFVDSTQGWLVTDDGLQSRASTAQYVTATGGTTATCGDFKTHTFSGPGTFCVSSAGNPSGSTTIDYLVVAGGGAGANNGNPGPDGTGGGGAGGFRLSNSYGSPAPTTSPLASPTGLPVSVTGYPVQVGGGGAGKPSSCSGNYGPAGNPGSNSVFAGSSTITSTAGGGAGGTGPLGSPGGSPGGSGGGSHQVPFGTGNTPPVSPPQGNPGNGPSGAPYGNGGGGGGGAGAAGGPALDGGSSGGGGGGIGSYVSPDFAGSNGTTGPVSARYFAGGGGGSNSPTRSPSGTRGAGGAGGGGNGGGCGPVNGANGTCNTGGGGGGAANNSGNSGSGGSGIVIIKYKFQN